MKNFIKGIVAVTLIFSLMCPVTAFTDIADENQAVAADTLNAVGVMQGVGDDKFDAKSTLTREQFAKIAVVGLNKKEQEALYKNYTIFPDVPYYTWSAGYVNAAAKLGLIGGYPDGTFKPTQQITDAQAIAICLRMMGYTVTDIGSIWPDSYVAKATQINLTNGLTISANQPMTRGRAAILVRNLLTLDSKDGTPMVSGLGKSTTKDVFIVATSDTDKTLVGNEIRINTSEKPVLCTSKLPVSLVGTQGTLILDTNNKITGYMPYGYDFVSINVKSATSSSVTDQNGVTYSFSSSTPIVIRNRYAQYADAWQNIVNGMSIRIYKDKTGSVMYLSYVYTSVDKGPF